MESILNTTKKLLGIPEQYTNFDTDIIVHINTAFSTLNQIGVGPESGFLIEDDSAVWSDYITSCNLTMVQTYIYLKVRLLFDPPTSGALMESMNRSVAELEWRLYLEGDKSE